MKTLPVLVLLALLPLAASAAPSRIKSVTVYADRAEITRSADAACTAGAAEALFEALPATLDTRTLRASASGKAKALAIHTDLVVLEQPKDARAAALQGEIEKLDLALEALANERQILSERSGTAAAYGRYLLAVMNEESREQKPNPARWTDALELLDREQAEVARRLVEIAAEERKLTRERDLLARRLAHLGSGQARQMRNARVGVDCAGAGSTKVSLSYVVPGATWTPEYDLRFTPSGGGKVGAGRVELTVSALIRQATGEDWDDARIHLSTARPKLGAEAPRPAPLYVDGQKVDEKKVLVQANERRAQLRGDAGASAGEAQDAAIDDRGQSFVLTIPHKASVNADGRPYWVPVDVVSAKAEATLVAIPKLTPYVYQVVSLENPAAYPLLAGRMHIHRGGSYVGDSRLEHRAPGEPFEISLGVDEEIEVKRIDLLEKDRRPGFLSGTKHIDRAYRVELHNRARGRVVVELRENVPVSKVEDVKVEIEKEKTTNAYAFDAHRGFVTWRLPLAEGEKKAIDLSYIVHLPSSWEVQ